MDKWWAETMLYVVIKKIDEHTCSIREVSCDFIVEY